MGQMQSYLCAFGAADSQRKDVQAVLAHPSSPEAWLQFLEREEADAAKQPASAARTAALSRLFHRATEMVQRVKGPGPGTEAYIRIWLGYARYQWYVQPMWIKAQLLRLMLVPGCTMKTRHATR